MWSHPSYFFKTLSSNIVILVHFKILELGLQHMNLGGHNSAQSWIRYSFSPPEWIMGIFWPTLIFISYSIPSQSLEKCAFFLTALQLHLALFNVSSYLKQYFQILSRTVPIMLYLHISIVYLPLKCKQGRDFFFSVHCLIPSIRNSWLICRSYSITCCWMNKYNYKNNSIR